MVYVFTCVFNFFVYVVIYYPWRPEHHDDNNQLNAATARCRKISHSESCSVGKNLHRVNNKDGTPPEETIQMTLMLSLQININSLLGQ